MSDDRLERALHAMTEEDVDARTLEAARARVSEKVMNEGAACAEFRQDFRAYLGHELRGSRPHPAGRPSQPLPRLSRPNRRAEGREAGCRHATAVIHPLGAMGRPRRGRRTGLRDPVSGRDSTRLIRCWVRAVRGPRSYPLTAACTAWPWVLSNLAPPSASGSRSARARELTRCCGSPTDRWWMSTSARSSS
jgi:hypothetical protein